MNSTELTAPRAVAATEIPEASGGLYQRLTLRALAQMPCGQLHLELPDGTIHRLGHRDRVRWHASTRVPAALAIPEAAAIRICQPAFNFENLGTKPTSFI